MIPQHFHSSPFKGLVPYSEEDARFFFGRESLRDNIIASLQTWRLTLLYGASGVGKSSVLNAGVLPRLHEMVREGMADNQRTTPEFSVIVFNSWQDNPVTGLARTIQDRLAELLQVDDQPVSAATTLTAAIDQWLAATDAELYIILDQFEEYFQYHGQGQGPEALAAELPRSISRSRQRIKFLISIREDALAKLDLFKGRLPNLFDHSLRVRPLTVEEARKAIEGPIDQYNALSGRVSVSIEAKLLEAVLQNVKRVDYTMERFGVEPAAGHIDAAILQQVMSRLWEEDIERDRYNTLRFETFERLGGAREIVSTHFSSTMDKLNTADQQTAAAIFRYLVTPSGTKIAQTAADLAAYSELSEASVTSVLQNLSSSDIRILRAISPPPAHKDDVRYEIFHDVLSGPINEWWREYEAEAQAQRQQLEALRDREIAIARYSRRVAVVLSVMLVMVSGLAVLAFQLRAEAAELASRESAAADGERVAKEKAEASGKETLKWAERESIARAKAEEETKKAREAEAVANDARNQAIVARDIANRRTEEMNLARLTESYHRTAFRQSRRSDQREEAIQNFNKALAVYLKLLNKDIDYVAATDTYVNIGEVSLEDGNESAASKSFQHAVSRCRTQSEKAAVLTNVGDAYRETNEWALGFDVDPSAIAIDKYTEAFWLYEFTGETKKQARVLINLALVKSRVAQNTPGDSLPEFEEAFALIEEAIRLYDGHKDHKGKGFAWLTLAKIKGQRYSPQWREAVTGHLEKALKEYELANDIPGQITVRKRLVGEQAAEPQKQLANLSEIARLYNKLADKSGQAATLADKAYFRLRNNPQPDSDEWVESIADYEKAAMLYEHDERPDKAAQIWSTVGSHYRNAKRTSAAVRPFEKAAALYVEKKNYKSAARVIYELSTLFSETDRARALDYLDLLVKLAGRLEEREKASVLLYLGNGFLALKDLSSASDYFEQSLKIYSDNKNTKGQISTLETISSSYVSLSMFKESLEYLDRLLTLYRADPLGEARTYFRMGSVREKKGQPLEAIEDYKRAAARYKELRILSEQIKALQEVGRIYRSQGRLDEAIATFGDVRDLFKVFQTGQSNSEGSVLEQMAQLYETRKDTKKAIELYEEAAASYNKRNLGKDESRVLMAISNIHETNCETDKAKQYKEKAEKASQATGSFRPPQP